MTCGVKKAVVLLGWVLFITINAVAQTLSQKPAVWEGDLGSGFKKNTVRAGVLVGGGVGLKEFGATERHDLVLSQGDLGWIFTDTVGNDKWYRGNWELAGSLFGGYQINHRDAYVVGLNGALRYDFATGSRWMPFFEAGAGPTFTDIGNPDLSTKFQFNLHAGVGLHYFWTDHLATTVQAHLLHLSNAGIQSPNQGVNNTVFLIGVNWFF